MSAPFRIADHFESIAQVAARWGVSTPRVLRYIELRRLEGVQYFNGRYFLPKGCEKPAAWPRNHGHARTHRNGERLAVHPDVLAALTKSERPTTERYALTAKGRHESFR